MLPIKLVRALTRDRRAQRIGLAISYTNDFAAYHYLKGTTQRMQLEKEAIVANATFAPRQEDSWIEGSWSAYYKSKRGRKAA